MGLTFSGERLKTTTSCLSLTNTSVSAEPINPLPPVIMIFISCPRLCSFLLRSLSLPQTLAAAAQVHSPYKPHPSANVALPLVYKLPKTDAAQGGARVAAPTSDKATCLPHPSIPAYRMPV